MSYFYIANILVGALAFRGAMRVYAMSEKNPVNLPSLIKHNPYLIKLGSPSQILLLQGLNGYLLTETLTHALLLPALTFATHFILLVIMRENLSEHTRWSFIMNPILHNFLFLLILVGFIIRNFVIF